MPKFERILSRRDQSLDVLDNLLDQMRGKGEYLARYFSPAVDPGHVPRLKRNVGTASVINRIGEIHNDDFLLPHVYFVLEGRFLVFAQHFLLPVFSERQPRLSGP